MPPPIGATGPFRRWPSRCPGPRTGCPAPALPEAHARPRTPPGGPPPPIEVEQEARNPFQRLFLRRDAVARASRAPPFAGAVAGHPRRRPDRRRRQRSRLRSRAAAPHPRPAAGCAGRAAPPRSSLRDAKLYWLSVFLFARCNSTSKKTLVDGRRPPHAAARRPTLGVRSGSVE